MMKFVLIVTVDRRTQLSTDTVTRLQVFQLTILIGLDLQHKHGLVCPLQVLVNGMHLVYHRRLLLLLIILVARDSLLQVCHGALLYLVAFHFSLMLTRVYCCLIACT